MNEETFIKKIDDLGRIVIPKEIRNRLKFLPNENLAISMKNDTVILNKCSLNKTIEQNIEILCNIFDEIYKIKYRVFVNDKKICSNLFENTFSLSRVNIIYNSITYGYIEYNNNIDDLKIIKLFSRMIAFLISIS